MYIHVCVCIEYLERHTPNWQCAQLQGGKLGDRVAGGLNSLPSSSLEVGAILMLLIQIN